MAGHRAAGKREYRRVHREAERALGYCVEGSEKHQYVTKDARIDTEINGEATGFTSCTIPGRA